VTTVLEPELKSKTRSAVSVTKRLILSLGDKGGVGKSFIIRKLAEMHMEAKTERLLVVDGDGAVSSLYKFHGGDRGPVEVFSIHGTVDERDRLINDILRRGSDLVVVDMPATSLTRLREMSADYNFVDEVEAAGYRLTVIAPITPYDDPILDLQESIVLLDQAMSKTFEGIKASVEKASTKPRVDYVAIVNLGFAEDRDDFELWDAPDAITRRLLQYVGGIELEIPKIRPRIAAKLQKYWLSFKAGEMSEHFSVTDRGRLHRWNEAVDKTLRSAGERLGF
jgi:hypothetical protein